jgi:hypothetical protein
VTQSAPTVSTKLARLAEQSKREPGRVFTALAHHLDEDFLTEAFQQLRPGAAAGIDEVTVAGYRQKLKENIHDLHQRLIKGQYRAQPARRVWIPKADGSQRPLAILVLEDKVVQRAVAMLLEAGLLHTVLDEWFETDVRPRMAGNCFLVRYADDFVMGFERKEDAEKVFRVLPKRFERYGLKIHPDKSRLLNFGRPPGPEGPGPGTFAFLGFTHYWDRTRDGGWTIKRQTERKRLSRFLSGLREWCRKHRHDDLTEQHRILTSKLRGHYQYYGVRSNYKLLEVAYEYAERSWKWWLGRRNTKDRMNWQKWMARWRALYPLPKPRIVHAF